jgi:imidazolonepropionase-like amidohydrolase
MGCVYASYLPGKKSTEMNMDTFLRRIIYTLVILCMSEFSMAQDNSFALTNANIFNGIDNEINESATVFVKDGKIERIAKSNVSISRTYTIIDLEGNYLLPGLFDVHTHVSTLDQANRALASGVTTIRSASVSAFQDIALRELVRSGKLPGPDVLAAGVFVTPDLGETVLADARLTELVGGVNSDAELRKLVNINVDRGVDVIKTRGTQRAGLPDTDPRQQVYTEHQLRVIVDEAARHGIPVMVHAHGDEGARAAVLAGARSIEHGTYLSTETLALMKERGTWMVPTYVIMMALNDEKYPSVLRLRSKSMIPHLDRAIRNALSMGIKLATGTDTYYDSESINRISIEVEHYVRLGMSNFEALQAATVNSAELVNLEGKTGRIVEGYEADMILVPANPLTHIEALQDVLLVMSNGQIALKRIPFAVME